MFMDKVKNFCDHSKILWEMAANRKHIGTLWPPSASFRVKICMECPRRTQLLLFIKLKTFNFPPRILQKCLPEFCRKSSWLQIMTQIMDKIRRWRMVISHKSTLEWITEWFAKLYTPSTIKIDFILRHRKLIVLLFFSIWNSRSGAMDVIFSKTHSLHHSGTSMKFTYFKHEKKIKLWWTWFLSSPSTTRLHGGRAELLRTEIVPVCVFFFLFFSASKLFSIRIIFGT